MGPLFQWSGMPWKYGFFTLQKFEFLPQRTNSHFLTNFFIRFSYTDSNNCIRNNVDRVWLGMGFRPGPGPMFAGLIGPDRVCFGRPDEHFSGIFHFFIGYPKNSGYFDRVPDIFHRVPDVFRVYPKIPDVFRVYPKIPDKAGIPIMIFLSISLWMTSKIGKYLLQMYIF